MEAERSEDDCSEDESDNSDQDQFDNSFINDFSQMSQTQANPGNIMQNVYSTGPSLCDSDSILHKQSFVCYTKAI